MIGELDVSYWELYLYFCADRFVPLMFTKEADIMLRCCSSSVLMIQLSEFDAHPSLGGAPTVNQLILSIDAEK